MKIKIKHLRLSVILSAALILALPTKAQVTIGVLRKPNATLEVAKLPDNSTTPDGFMPPRLTLAELNARIGKYTADQTGAVVYVTDTIGGGIVGYSDLVLCTGLVTWNGNYWESRCSLLEHFEKAISQPKAFSFYEQGTEPTVTPLVFGSEGAPAPITYQWYKIVGSNINFRVAAPCTSTDGTGFATNTFTPNVLKGSTIDANNTGFYKYYCVAKNSVGDSIESNLAEVAVGCGAKDMYGDWISFMCFNLGANNQTIAQQKTTSITLTPNAAVASTFFRSANERNLYGDLYQWGRIADGHERRDLIVQGSAGAGASDNWKLWNTTATPTYETGTNGLPWNQVSRTDPNGYYGKFITTTLENNWNWYAGSSSDQSNADVLWRDAAFPNNDPCQKVTATGTVPSGNVPAWYGTVASGTGWRLPSQSEWSMIYRGGNINGSSGSAYANNWNWYQLSATDGAKGMEVKPDGLTTTLFLPASGNRNYNNASLYYSGIIGNYWSGTSTGVNSFALLFGSGAVSPAYVNARGDGLTLRCVKN